MDVKLEDHMVMWGDNGMNWDASQLGCQGQLCKHPFQLDSLHSGDVEEFKLSLNSQFNSSLIVLLLKCFTDLKSHNTSLTTTPPPLFRRDCAPSMAVVMHCSPGPEGCRRAWDFYCELFSLIRLDRRGIECLAVKCAARHTNTAHNISTLSTSSACSYSDQLINNFCSYRYRKCKL